MNDKRRSSFLDRTLRNLRGAWREFAGSAEKMLEEIFSPSRSRRLPPDDAIYTMPDMRIEDVRYTKRARQRGMFDQRPQVRGITIDGRIAVLFSDLVGKLPYPAVTLNTTSLLT